MKNHNTNPGQTPNEGQDYSQQSPGQGSVDDAKNSQSQYRPDGNLSSNPGSPGGNDETGYDEADRDEADRDEKSNVADDQSDEPEDDDSDMEDESGGRGDPANQ